MLVYLTPVLNYMEASYCDILKTRLQFIAQEILQSAPGKYGNNESDDYIFHPEILQVPF